jgi:hypothetical protein
VLRESMRYDAMHIKRLESIRKPLKVFRPQHVLCLERYCLLFRLLVQRRLKGGAREFA